VRFRFIIETCEYCNEEGAEIPFDNILERVTGSDPTVTDFIFGSAGEVPELLSRDVPRKNADRRCEGLPSDHLVDEPGLLRKTGCLSVMVQSLVLFFIDQIRA
jgi:hypothetical protein